ncbi:beta-N-acetylhexosaminidase [Chitinasiproducens palmae]|nr:beta-N-acetylhexosaminidase [Chitinasiproducens palmae]
MLDVLGTELNADDRRRLRDPATGGVILFARNFVSRAQLLALTAAIRAVRPELLIAVDQEGGRVQRFRTDGFTRVPPMREIGRVAATDLGRGIRLAAAAGFVLAAELRAHGVDLSFTPVLDVDIGRSSVIGDRAFDGDATRVALLAGALNGGLLAAGMANCGKHFPGHGHVAADTHASAASDERDRTTLLRDARDFLAVGASLRAVMAAHVVYPAVDSVPAGFSKVWLKDVLRGQLGFDGAVFSDDLSMAGARVAGDVLAGARMALRAGCDMVLVCNDGAAADRVLDGLGDGLGDGSSDGPSDGAGATTHSTTGAAAGAEPAAADSASFPDWDRASRQRIAALRPSGTAWDFETLRGRDDYQLAVRALAALAAVA